MERRRFLQAGALAGLAAAARGQARPASKAPARAGPGELDEIGIVELGQGMASGRFTALGVTRMYLRRIQEVDRGGPRLNSVLEVNPEAEAIAASLDRERKAGHVRGPMHGIPVLIKDNIDTADRMQTTAGSLALLGSKPRRDAAVVERLRAAGAVLLGKTNLSEWANMRSSHSTSGWSGRGGQTHNPYALDRNPCGSSSGSGAAAAASLCAVAVGTETDGSVVCPSSANGIVGLKPTVGLVSRAGIVPISHTQDTAGPMGRTVRDVAILLGAMTADANRDAVLDPATAASRGHAEADYTRFLDPRGLQGARLGVARQYFGFNDAVDALMESVLGELQRAGAVLIDPVKFESFGKFDDSEQVVLTYELKADLNAYLAGRPGAPRDLAALIAFNQQHRAREMPYFGQDLFETAQRHGPLSSEEYLKALANDREMARTQGMDAVMDQFRLDAVLAPTANPAWLTDWVNGDHDTGGSSNFAAVAGYPDISVPAGYVFGLPVGLSLFGRAWSEPKLLRLAYACERVLQARRPPKLLPTMPMPAAV